MATSSSAMIAAASAKATVSLLSAQNGKTEWVGDDVRFGSEADLMATTGNVRLVPQADMRALTEGVFNLDEALPSCFLEPCPSEHPLRLHTLHHRS